jgi:hypothetical protein
MTGRIGVYSLSSTALTKMDEIEVGMPIDNLSVDANGDIFAGAFPDALKVMDEVKNATGALLPSTVWQIKKESSESDRNGKGAGKRSSTDNYRVGKVLEDREGKLLPSGTTTAVHDVKTGKIFLGGVLSEHITVCEHIPIAK